METRDKLVKAACSQVDRGIYVWGARGQDVSSMSNPYKWILSKEKGVRYADGTRHHQNGVCE
jgi:hypothetical protein